MADNVSVVIPTIGREELERAVDSVRRQEHPDVQLIVVADLPEDDPKVSAAVRDRADLVLWTGGGRRGSHARNLGVQQATGDWVAFLDDDDEWLPTKLTRQVAAARSAGPGPVVVASRHFQVDDSGRTSKPLPLAAYRDGPVEDYLFRRRRAAGGRASIYTSTLLTSAGLAREVGWDDTLSRHQDWDWLVRATRSGGRLVQLDSPEVRIYTGSTGSISAQTDWRTSAAWAVRALGSGDPQTLVDFLFGQSLRYALSAGSLEGVRHILGLVVRTRRVPSPGPLVIALGGLVPRRWIERLMVRLR